MNKMDEIILIVPRSDLFADETLTFQGTDSRPWKTERLMDNISDNYSSMRRGDAEENSSFKQPIPYAVIRRGDDIFMYERLKGGGETRLHNQLSLGVGGHMNAIDDVQDFSEVLSINLDRELEEELHITDKDIRVKVIGLINDDGDEVGRVHIGLLSIIDVALDSEVTVREVDQLKGQWVKLEELKDDGTYSRLESWSKFVVDIL